MPSLAVLSSPSLFAPFPSSLQASPQKVLLQEQLQLQCQALASAPRMPPPASLEEGEQGGVKPLLCEVQVVPLHPQEHQLASSVHLLQPQPVLWTHKCGHSFPEPCQGWGRSPEGQRCGWGAGVGSTSALQSF